MTPRERRLEEAPIPMVLVCPLCRARHIDVGEFATKPHHTHACQECGFVWRPAIGPTVGVQFLPGFKNDAALSVEGEAPACARCNGGGDVPRGGDPENGHEDCPDCKGTGEAPAPTPSPAPEATHRCKVCGARWRLNPPTKVQPEGSWFLVYPSVAGKCCDNVAMGDQIEATGGEPRCVRCGEEIRPDGAAWMDCETHTTCEESELPHVPASTPSPAPASDRALANFAEEIAAMFTTSGVQRTQALGKVLTVLRAAVANDRVHRVAGSPPSPSPSGEARPLHERIYEGVRSRFNSSHAWPLGSGPDKDEPWWNWLAVWLKSECDSALSSLRGERDRWKAAAESAECPIETRLEQENSSLRARAKVTCQSCGREFNFFEPPTCEGITGVPGDKRCHVGGIRGDLGALVDLFRDNWADLASAREALRKIAEGARSQTAHTGMSWMQVEKICDVALSGAPPAPAPAPEESGWLIEWKPSTGPHRWFDGLVNWTEDSAQAIRFSRKTDAERVMPLAEAAGHFMVPVCVTEHVWVLAPKPVAQEDAPAPKIGCEHGISEADEPCKLCPAAEPSQDLEGLIRETFEKLNQAIYDHEDLTILRSFSAEVARRVREPLEKESEQDNETWAMARSRRLSSTAAWLRLRGQERRGEGESA